MPRDHYVAQTYLRRFAGPGGMLQAYRKDGGAPFSCWPRDVCAIEDDDIIPDFLAEPEFLGMYRAVVEPAWNEAVDAIAEQDTHPEVKRRISLYWANLLVCTPSWTRIGVDQLNHLTEIQIHAHLRHNLATLGEDLRPGAEAVLAGRLRPVVEPDYVRALSAVHALRFAWGLYNSEWIVCESRSEVDYITSDNPSSFNDPGDGQWLQSGIVRYLPISPRLCIACRMDERVHALIDAEPAFEQDPAGAIQFAGMPTAKVQELNETIAKCAEKFVLCGASNDYVRELTARVALFRVENERIAIPQVDGILCASRVRVVEH